MSGSFSARLFGSSAECQPEHVDLDAFLDACRDARKSEQAELAAGAARRARDGQETEIVLADRGRRQVDAQLGILLATRMP